jgi:hypothetical protein
MVCDMSTETLVPLSCPSNCLSTTQGSSSSSSVKESLAPVQESSSLSSEVESLSPAYVQESLSSSNCFESTSITPSTSHPIITVMVHLNSVLLTLTPTHMIWFPRHLATIATLRAPTGYGVSNSFSLLVGMVFPERDALISSICLEPTCNLLFAPTRIFIG